MPSYYRKDMTQEEAIELGKRAILHATHRDAYSGGINNGEMCVRFVVSFGWLVLPVYHVNENGWTKVWSNDTHDMFYKYYPVEQVLRGEGAAPAVATA